MPYLKTPRWIVRFVNHIKALLGKDPRECQLRGRDQPD
jgi:hypothetical protein